MTSVNFLFPILIINLLIIDLTQHVEGLNCYVSVDPVTGHLHEERIVDCTDLFRIPSKQQMTEAVAKDSTLMKGKVVCEKVGAFVKSCAFIKDEIPMGCNKKMTPEEVETVLKTLKQDGTGALPPTECFCNTDKCNDGSRPRPVGGGAFGYPIFMAFLSWASGKMIL